MTHRSDRLEAYIMGILVLTFVCPASAPEEHVVMDWPKARFDGR